MRDDSIISGAMPRVRAWLRSDMRVLRWVFLGLYVLLLSALMLVPLIDTDAEAGVAMLIAIGVMFAGQAILIFGSGTISLCRPIRKRRLFLPVFVAATMLALLAGGLLTAMWELLHIDRLTHDDSLGVAAATVVGLSWIAWGVLMIGRMQHLPRHSVLRRLNAWLFAGSLAELLATVPSHVIVSRRPGCLVGFGTRIGIIAGCCVMIFSFGPAIAILFLRPRWRAETADGIPYCSACGYDLRASKVRCPECGVPFEEDKVTR